jgi:N-acetylornithine carbamoyltransferase
MSPTLAAADHHLLSLRDLGTADWNQLLTDAETLAGPAGKQPLLAGRRFGMLLLNPSLRTRTAFEVGCQDLGTAAVTLQPGGDLWALEHRDGVVMDGDCAEHVTEIIGVLGRMLDALGVRAFAGLTDVNADRSEPVLSAIVKHASIPVLNLESAFDHPHQGLADALTLRRRFGYGQRVKVVLRWAPHVKTLPMAVPHAALCAFAREGHEIVVAHPEGYELDASVIAAAEKLSTGSGGSLAFTHDKDAALAGADVIYAKSWGSPAHYGQASAAAEDMAARRDWMVTSEDMAATRSGVFMHCLPVRRNVVVTDDVLDSDASIVLDQAEARLDIQKASLCRAVGVQP